MDESADKDRSSAASFSGSKGHREDESLGATGVFRAVGSTGKGLEDAQPLKPVVPGNQELMPRRTNVPDIERLAEPVVHRVVLDSIPPASSHGMPARVLRTATSPADNATQRTTIEPASQGNSAKSDFGSGEGGEAGFTQILQSMGLDSKGTRSSTIRIPNQTEDRAPGGDGFTALLRSLSHPGGADRSVESQLGSTVSPVPLNVEKSAKGPAASGAGEFTAQLSASQSHSEAGSFDGAKGSAGDRNSQTPTQPSAAIPSRAGSEPGEFTKLLGSFAEDETSANRRPTDRTGRPQADPVGTSSFSKLLAVDQGPGANSSVFPVARTQEERDFRFRDAPPITRGPASSNESFAIPPGEKSPLAQNPHAESDVGITRLIQMLDNPSLTSDRAKEISPSVPATTPAGTNWTHTFGELTETDAPRPSAPRGNQSVGAFGPVSGPQPGRIATQGPTADAASGAASGPSEYTRILDASRMRESSRVEAQKAEAASAAPATPAAKPAAPSSAGQMPSYPVQLPYPMQSMPGVGGMPQVGGFPQSQSPQIPGYPMNMTPGGGAFSGGSMPQMPGVYLPSAPQLPALQTPAVGSNSAGLGKLQKYIPLLLIVIIFLLVGLLVTVVFLLKH